jgi:hypothetical protein
LIIAACQKGNITLISALPYQASSERTTIQHVIVVLMGYKLIDIGIFILAHALKGAAIIFAKASD